MQKVILITGASSGIGKAITEYLAEKSCLIFAGARKQSDIENLNSIENVQAIQLDITKQDQIAKAVETIKQKHGSLDCLINNAGVMGWGSVIDREMKYFNSIFQVNLWGAIRMVQAFYPLLKKSQNNPIIFNISSQGSNYTLPFWSPYMMSKYAMKAFSSTLRQEFLTTNIRVVEIAPGAFKSDMLEKQKQNLENYGKKYKSEFTQKVIKMLSVPINKDRKREQSPVIVGKLIYKIMNNKSRKARYQPGKQFIPDILLEKFPTGIIDKIILKMMK